MRKFKSSTGGKFLAQKPSKKKAGRLPFGKHAIIVMAIALLTIGIVGGTVAWLAAKSEPVENRFSFAHVSCEIQESFQDNVKSNVQVKNTGDADAYIRARIVVTWQDADGNVFAQTPQAGTDYALSLNENGWLVGGDGYYYCTDAVAPDEANNLTPVLIQECKPVEGAAPEGYSLNVEILADAIQSTPVRAVIESWGVIVSSDGTISGK